MTRRDFIATGMQLASFALLGRADDGLARARHAACDPEAALARTHAALFNRINRWMQQGLIDAELYTPERIAAAYQWVLETIGTRAVSLDEVNPENEVLWDGVQALGVHPSLYHLNRFAPGRSPSPVNDKLDAARQLLLDAVQEILFAPTSNDTNLRTTGRF